MESLVNRSAAWHACIVALVVPTGFGLGGCVTHLASAPLDAITKEPVHGVVYYLPKTVLDVDVTLQLKDCRVEQRGSALVFHFDVAQSAEVVARTVADTSHGYVVNYEDLSAATKTTSATIELTKVGTLKSLNVDVKDQTATVISNAVSSAVKIASTISRVPLPTSTGSNDARDREERYCGPAAKQAFQRTRELERAVSTASSEEKSKLTEEIAVIRRAELTHRMFVHFDPKPGNDGRSVAAYPTQPVINGWISAHGLTHLKEQRPELFVGTSLGPLRTEVAIAWPASAGTPLVSAPLGIVYRQPLEAEVAVCAAQCGGGGGVFHVPRSDRVYSVMHSFPQLGQLAVLPLRNSVFQDNVLKADWGETGGVTRVEFTRSSQAEKASTTILDASGKVAQFVTSRRAADAAAVAKAREDELAEIVHRMSVLDALKKLKESQDAYDAKFAK